MKELKFMLLGVILLISQGVFSQIYFQFPPNTLAPACNDYKDNFSSEWLPSHGTPNSYQTDIVKLRTVDHINGVKGEGVFLNLKYINGVGFESGHSYKAVFYYKNPYSDNHTFRAYIANSMNEQSLNDCSEEAVPNVSDKMEVYTDNFILGGTYSWQTEEISVEFSADKDYDYLWIFSDLTATYLDNKTNFVYITQVSLEDLGSGEPNCISNLAISQDVSSGSDIQEAENTITATNSISNGATAEYDAGTSILLKPGFHAKQGSSFRAYIEGCTPSNSNGRMSSNTVTNENSNKWIRKPTENPKKTEAISTYPNPTAGVVTINFADNDVNMESIRIVDKLNQNIRFSVLQKDKNKITIRIHGGNEEIYFMKINTNNGVLTEKIVIKK